MKGVLRQATRADLAGIWRVRYAVTENTLTPGRITDDEVVAQLETTGRGWVVAEDGQLVGFAIGDAVGANLWALFVDPRIEGRGYGSLLHDTLVEWMWERGLATLWLDTGTVTKARGFYERRGWRLSGPDDGDQVRLELANAWA
jgi:GNAT superfamily N-acetyltransferase